MLRWLMTICLGFGLWLASSAAWAQSSTPLTCDYSVMGQIDSPGDPKQLGRVTQGNLPSTCAAAKPFPGTSDATGRFSYDAYVFKNRSNQTCINVTLTATTGSLSSAAYTAANGVIFDANNVSTNYVGDTGSAATVGTPRSFAFNVPKLQDFVVVVNEMTDGGEGRYTLSVRDCGAIIVNSVTPNFGPVAGGTRVTIRGAGFTSNAQVTFGGTPGTDVVVNSEFELLVTTPAHAAGAVNVVVRNGEGGPASTLPNGFTYYDAIAPTVTLTTSPNPSVFGQSVTFSATVTPTVPRQATGNVTFWVGGTQVGTAQLSNGTATLSKADLGVGVHTVQARYAGDALFGAGNSTNVSHTVNKANTTTAVSSSSNPSVVNAAVTFTARVDPQIAGSGPPTGNVVFTVNGTARDPIALNANRSATLSVTPTAEGTITVSAQYQGDTNFNASTGTLSPAQTVNLIGTTVTVTSSPNPSAFGASVTFTATVTTNSGGAPPTGTVTFLEGATPFPSGAVTLNQGSASFSVNTLTPGTHVITAQYSGDGVNQAGSGTVSHVVQLAPTTTTLTSSVNPSAPGQSVTFTAQVTSAIAGAITGDVTFSDGTTVLGQATVDAEGKATFTTSELPNGTRSITASYEGDAVYDTSTSTELAQVVGTPTGDAGTDGGDIDGSVGADSGLGSDANIPDLDGSIPSGDAGPGIDPNTVEGGGCGCTTVGTSDSGALTALGAFFGLVLALARRRRK